MKKILTMALLALGVTSSASAANLTEADVKRIVAEYIQNNGEEITMSMDRFLKAENVREANRMVYDYTPTLGNDDAKVTLIEFSDYRCGYCLRVQDTVNQLRDKYGDKVRFAFKNLPILSEESYDAAVAAMAAGEQGKFWEYNTRLWSNQSRIKDGDRLFNKLAKELKLDMDKFEKDRESELIQARVISDIRDARSKEMTGTPNFLINGEQLSGAVPIERFEALLNAALAQAEKN